MLCYAMLSSSLWAGRVVTLSRRHQTQNTPRLHTSCVLPDMVLAVKCFVGKFFLCCLLILAMNRLIRSTAAKSVLLSSTALLMTPKQPFKSTHSSSAAMNAATAMPSSSSVDAQNNPLLLQSGLPKFQKIEPSHVVPAIEHQLATFAKDFEQFEKILNNPQQGEVWGKKRMEYDYEMVVEYLEKLQAPISYSWGCVGHLMGVRNSPELRSAHESMQPRVVQVFQQVGQSQALFKVFANIFLDFCSRVCLIYVLFI